MGIDMDNKNSVIVRAILAGMEKVYEDSGVRPNNIVISSDRYKKIEKYQKKHKCSLEEAFIKTGAGSKEMI